MDFVSSRNASRFLDGLSRLRKLYARLADSGGVYAGHPHAPYQGNSKFALTRRLPKHDVGAGIRITNNDRSALVETCDASVGYRRCAIRFRSCVRCFDIAHLERRVIRIDVLKLQRRRSLSLVRRKREQLDAQVV